MPATVLRRLGTGLSEEERLRAARLVGLGPALAFLGRRIVARTVASWYTGKQTADVRWIANPMGKPALQVGLRDADLQFSWSQAGTMVAVAVSVSSPVGVDAVEGASWKQLDGAMGVFCSRDEELALHRLPPARRSSALVQCWAGKEACLKAAGIGLLGDPRGVQTWEGDHPQQRVVWQDVLMPGGLCMTIQHVQLDRGVRLAVACAKPEWHLVHRTLTWRGENAHGCD
ncbi:MAG: 4'-phosphopantetheinyl transferase superfamily protein [Caldiserica bacterium]|nr:4'-phosphopantetheinyl transferase superfamily protein [Caldisericota bacterium]